MTWQRLKKRLTGAVLVLLLVLGSGVILQPTAEAQIWRRGRNDQRNREEVNRGYHDGLDRGEEDARDRRRADPNNSEHYRHGNSAYREGFRRGYSEGYRRYRYRR
ncbi:MAG TPA: hypothetical protein VKA60_20045 [Blastocatellia bacterium]|nr:hypothetical protein [Blastocatellia bacterium]